MLLYHYSVDSYQGGGELINDFKNNCRFAEPFLLALDKGGDCFWSVYFAAMSYSRELCALGLRKHENYAKDAVEGIFEWVRRRDFSADSASRVGCVYYCESKDEAIAYLKADCLDNGDFSVDQVKLLEVEVDAARVFRYELFPVGLFPRIGNRKPRYPGDPGRVRHGPIRESATQPDAKMRLVDGSAANGVK